MTKSMWWSRLWEKTCTLFDKNTYSFCRKPGSLVLCSDVPVSRLCLERHNEIHIFINCFLTFRSLSVKILLLLLPSNFLWLRLAENFTDISSTSYIADDPKSRSFSFSKPYIILYYIILYYEQYELYISHCSRPMGKNVNILNYISM
jgi:hypothetical protein